MLSRYRRCVFCLVVFVILAVLLWTWLSFVPYGTTSRQGDGESSWVMEGIPTRYTGDEQSVKNILFWYEPYKPQQIRNHQINAGVGQGPAGPSTHSKAHRLTRCLAKCDVFSRDQRIVSWDTMKTYDAVVFHQRGWTPDDLPTMRLSHQKFVFLSMESPAWRFVDTETMANFFNWTMTYRRDSDIFNPYGSFSSVNSTLTASSIDSRTLKLLLQETRLNPVNYGSGKTKKVAWFVSNCKSLSGRNEYVDRLKTFIDVDIFGQCGSMRCSRSNPESCRQMLERDYKFYLALENTLCGDYVTEKFFAQMRYKIVPIVFDLHGHHKRLAPPHSFINAADFPSVLHLANYLTLLDRNDALYNEYFWWKNHYVVHESHDDPKSGMCRLCDLLHNSTTQVKIYHNMTDWWDAQSKCQTLLRFADNPHTNKNDSFFYWESLFT